MAIINGLRGGQPSYFMYQPSRGIDVQGLGQLILSDPNAKAATTQGDDTKGLIGQRIAYDDTANSIAYREKELKMNAMQSGVFRADNPDLLESPEYQTYVKGMNQLQAEKQVLSQNKMKMESNLEQADADIGEARKKGTLTSNFLRKSNVSGMRYEPVAFVNVGEQKVEVPTFVADKEGNPVLNKDINGYFNVQDYHNYQRLTTGFNPETGYADPLSASAQYTPGDLSNKTSQFFNDVKTNMTEVSDGFTVGGFAGIDAKFVFSSSQASNIDQLASAVASGSYNFSEADYAELSNDYISAIQSGQRVMWPGAEGKAKAVSVGDLTPDQYYAAKTLGLSSAYHRIKDTKDAKQITIKDKTEGDGITDRINFNAAVLNPGIISELGVASSGNFFTSLRNNPQSGDPVDNQAQFQTYRLPISDVEVAKENRALHGGQTPATVDGLPNALTKGVTQGILPGGGVLNFDQMDNVKVLGYTGTVVLAPAFETDEAGLITDKMKLVTDDSGNPEKYSWKDEQGKTHYSFNTDNEVYREVTVVIPEDQAKNIMVPGINDKKKIESGEPSWVYKPLKKVDSLTRYGQAYRLVDKELNDISTMFDIGGLRSNNYVRINVLVPAKVTDTLDPSSTATKYNKDLAGRALNAKEVYQQVIDEKNRAAIQAANANK